MREMPYQAVLFDMGTDEPVTHFFYATTNSIVVKVGYAKTRDDGQDAIAARMKRDGQFKGHLEIWRIPCNCPLHIVMGRKQCEREISWWDAHAVDRLPASELCRPSHDVRTALYFRARNDPRAMAVMNWLEQHVTGQSA
jgi:hypothetical protein